MKLTFFFPRAAFFAGAAFLADAVLFADALLLFGFLFIACLLLRAEREQAPRRLVEAFFLQDCARLRRGNEGDEAARRLRPPAASDDAGREVRVVLDGVRQRADQLHARRNDDLAHLVEADLNLA